jgi:hypothetical protein
MYTPTASQRTRDAIRKGQDARAEAMSAFLGRIFHPRRSH